MKTKQRVRAKHLPILLPGSCDRIKFCITLGEFDLRILKNLRRQIWQRIAKGRATTDEHELYQLIDIEILRHAKISTNKRGSS
ncbi:MAG: hypothetical protein P1P90_04315 [Patescibacteria group bacterium]|nr:hypothetical protein [Patescibacteria group bacterium]